MTITGTRLQEVAAKAVKARHLRDVSELDYVRLVVVMVESGMSQTKIAKLVGVTQPTISKLLHRSASVPMAREGFSGADPFEICERYAADLITRDQLVDELTRWDYTPRQTTANELDDLVVHTPGSTADLERALRRGLIDDDLFDEVADRLQFRLPAA